MRVFAASLFATVFLLPGAALADIDGEEIYNNKCGMCHNAGVLNAPKLGDKEAWAPHIEHGLEHMVDNAINGIGKMPPKGGHAALSDAEVKAAVEYMVKQAE